jgi:hypothetical protein
VIRRNVFAGNVLTSGENSFPSGAGLAVGRGGAPNPTLDQSDNVFDRNRITVGPSPPPDLSGRGAGEVLGSLESVTSRRDRFSNNSLPAITGSGELEGAGVAVEGCSPEPPRPDRIEDAMVAGNHAGGAADGAGVYVGCGDGPVAMTIVDSTVAGNSSPGGTAGVFGGPDDTLTMQNSIDTGNTGGSNLAGFSTRTVARSDACGAGGAIGGSGNICAPPLLVDPTHGDAHETQRSPTIDRGSNALIPAGLTKDFDGDPRIVGAAVDMGADEFAKPYATTGGSKNVKITSASVAGVVNPNGRAAAYRFEYGRTTAYGKSTKGRALPKGTTGKPVSAKLAKLPPNATIHYRLVASSSAGATRGADRTLKTKKDPFAGVKIAGKGTLDSHGRVRVGVTCPKGTPGKCTGRLTLRRGSHKLGSKGFSIKSGKHATVKVHLSASDRQSLESAGSVQLHARAKAHDGAGTVRAKTGEIAIEQ